jgi:hypothetical protein
MRVFRAASQVLSVLVISGELAAGDDVVLTRGPYLQALLATSVEIVWRTDAPSLGAVLFGEEGAPPRGVREPEAGLVHRVRLEGLTPGRVYRYEILDGDRSLTAVEDFRFRAAPEPGGGSVRAVALGDSGIGSDEQYELAALLCDLAPDLILHTGDIDYLGNTDRSIFEPYRESLAGACLYPCQGNHDLGLPWEQLFFPPLEDPGETATFYSFDWGDAHFAVLDTNLELEADSAQIRWLDADLEVARAAGRAWVILYFHEPPYSVGVYAFDGNRLRETIVPLVDRWGVDLVLSGHDHNYQRTHPLREDVARDAWQDPSFASPAGTIYVVTGGGGQSLYPELSRSDHRYHRLFRAVFHLVELEITPDELSVRALGREREVIDAFNILKNRPRPDLEFLRGDVNADRLINIADAVSLLNYLFLGGVIESFCPAAADLQATGEPPGLDDAVSILNYLFLGGRTPRPPFPACGPAAADDAFCLRSGC